MNRTGVVLVSYKGAADTEFCLKSLQASTAPVQVVVVDTTPFDPELVSVMTKFPDVPLIAANENLGFGRGNNVGLRWLLEHARCEFVFILNNDASVLPLSIAKLESTMDLHPEISIMTPRIVYRDRPDKLWYGGGHVDWRRASVFTPGFNEHAEAPEAMRSKLVTFASGCALFVRRKCLLDVGGFDPRFLMYEEDVEWCLRATKLGYSILYEAEALILHRAQGGSKSEQEEDRSNFWATTNPRLCFYAFHIIRNRLINVFTHASSSQKLTVAIFFPLYLARRAGPFLLGGRVDAIVAMLRGAMSSWKARRAVTVAFENDFSMIRDLK